MASLADLVTLVTRVWISSQEEGETGEGELCADLVSPHWMMMFVPQLSAITRIISSGGAGSHWTLWWISLVSWATDNNWPQKQNTDYTKNKMHYIYVIITYQRINCEMCWWFSRNRIVSFFPSRKLLQFLLLLLLSQLLDPGCQSLCIHQDGVPHFLWDRHPAHLLASLPILLFQAVSGGNEMLQLW